MKYFSEDADVFDEIIDGSFLQGIPGTGIQELFSFVLSEIAPLYKHEAFKDEKEWRLILKSLASPAPSATGIKFREGQSMLIPYREADLRSISTAFIKSVTIGPTPHKELSMKSIKLLRSFGIEGCEVKHSKVPYRHW